MKKHKHTHHHDPAWISRRKIIINKILNEFYRQYPANIYLNPITPEFAIQIGESFINTHYFSKALLYSGALVRSVENKKMLRLSEEALKQMNANLTDEAANVKKKSKNLTNKKMIKKYRRINELKLQMLVQTGEVSDNYALEVWQQFRDYELPHSSLHTKILDLYFSQKCNEHKNNHGG